MDHQAVETATRQAHVAARCATTMLPAAAVQPRRISLSAGPGENPAPPSRPQRPQVLLSGAAAVAVAAILFEVLLVKYRTQSTAAVNNGVIEATRAVQQLSACDARLLLGLLLVAALLLLCASKAAAEGRLAAKARRKLCEKLEDSFDHPSQVEDAWMRVGGETQVGFGVVTVSAADPSPPAVTLPAAGNKEASEAAAAAGNLPEKAADSVLAVRAPFWRYGKRQQQVGPPVAEVLYRCVISSYV